MGGGGEETREGRKIFALYSTACTERNAQETESYRCVKILTVREKEGMESRAVEVSGGDFVVKFLS